MGCRTLAKLYKRYKENPCKSVSRILRIAEASIYESLYPETPYTYYTRYIMSYHY